MSFLLLLLGGIFFGLMVSMNGRLAVYLNLYEISFLVHSIGAILLLGYIRLIKREKIRLSGAPGYVYFVGFLGVALVVTSSLSAAHIGAAVTMALSIAGQLAVSAMIDSFGWFRVPAAPFRAWRLPAYGIILAGLLIMIYA